VTRRGPGAKPLATVVTGVGNGDGTEGAYGGRVVGTYLHGPALVRNPGLADMLLGWVAGALPPVDPGQEDLVQQLRAERLAAQSAPA
jgi:CobQ-like glutamine amidotransferase family enzyme